MVWNIYFAIYIYIPYWECHPPNWRTHIFQRVRNHQPEKIAHLQISNNSTYQVVAIRSQLGIHVDDLSWPVGATDKVS